MSLLSALASAPVWTRVAFGSLFQGTVVVLSAALVARLFLRRRAAARHGLWLGALLWLVISPAVAAVADRAGITLWAVSVPAAPARAVEAIRDEVKAAPVAGEAPVESASREAESAEVAVLAAPTDPVPAPTDVAPGIPDDPGPVRTLAVETRDALERPEPEPEATGPGWPSVVVGVWMAGVLFGLSRIMVGWFRLARVLRRARPFDAGRHVGAFAQAREALGVSVLPSVVTSSEASGPVAAGVLQPRVVLPERLARVVNGPTLRDVLVHECAHALRGDPRIGLFQRLAAAFFWPHPLVHLVNAQLDRAREEVCDNHVLRFGDPCGYARTLLTLTEFCRPYGPARAGLGLLGIRWTLSDRVAGLLDPGRIAMTRMTLRGRFAVALALTAAGVAVAGVRLDRTARAAASDQPEAPVAAKNQDRKPDPDDPGRKIRGIVVDDQGKPVVGAAVRLSRGYKAPEGAVTNPDGTFTLTLLGRMLLNEDLIAEADRGARLGLARFEEPIGSKPPEPVRITLKPSRPLTVHVRDRKGDDVEGAEVVAFDFGFSTQARTDATGTAVLRVPADPVVRWVFALKPQAGFDYFENYATRGDRDLRLVPDEVVLELSRARTVRVKAVDSAGKPLPGVDFTPWYLTMPHKVAEVNVGGLSVVRATTDADGVAAFDWLPEDVVPGITFLVRSDEFSCPDWPIYRTPNPTELTARLLRNTRISGTVRFPDGRPAGGILIEAEGRGPTPRYGRAFTRTRPDGTYAANVDPQQAYIVAVLDDEWAARSHTDVVIREGKPEGGLDFSLIKGTLIRGRITTKPEGRPAPGVSVTLSQEGGPAPADLRDQGRGEGKPTLNRFTTTDAEGRYAFRVGPGRYTIPVPRGQVSGELTVDGDSGPDLVRDTALPAPRSIRGVVLRKAPDGDRPLAGAIVEAAPINQRGGRLQGVADAEGHFRMDVPLDGPDKLGALVFYARGADGQVAGLTLVGAGSNDVTAHASEAARVTGRVVDEAGRPRAQWPVSAWLEKMIPLAGSARFARSLLTDADGRFTWDGVPVDARIEVSVPVDMEDQAGGSKVQSSDVRGPDPIALGDLVVSSRKAPATRAPAPAEPEEPRARIATVPAGPSRAEIEALIQAVGRDKVTPELADRIALMFRPQVLWARDFERTKARATDPDFVRRFDAAAKQVDRKPATTLELIQWGSRYHVGQDDAYLTEWFREERTGKRPRPVEFWGVVLDVQSGNPVAGARVYTDAAIARTGLTGRFALSATPREPGDSPLVWVEADGYALREIPVAADGVRPLSIYLVRAVPFEGRVVDEVGKPVAGASVTATVSRQAVALGNVPRDHHGNALSLTVLTDARGWFSVPGVPPSNRAVTVNVTHPEYRKARASSPAPTSPDSPPVVRLERGSIVGGVVVDEQGRPVPGASVQIRTMFIPGYEHMTLSDREGRFEFRNVRPDRWDLLVEPERLAPTLMRIVADMARPVESQVVLTPGGYITGKVLGEDEKPAAGVTVGWVDSVGLEMQNLGRSTSTAADGTFRIGPLPPGEFSLTALVSFPRRLGKTTARVNQAGVVIRLKPDSNGR